MKKVVICLIGPTAVGKTEVAVELARRVGAEIISCDSMQVYQGVDIATGKPTKKQRRATPHHLLSILKPAQEYNAARFQKSARRIIRAIHKRGRLPLIVAGSGLYLRALLDGLFRGPGGNPLLRRKLYLQAQKQGVDFLYKRLKDVDPQAARSIHAHDLRRIVRALEVYETTGEPISRLRRDSCGIRDKYKLYLFGLYRPREQLYARIEKRVERMFRQGLVEEIRRFSGYRLSKTAKALLGYKEIKGYLEGRYSCAEAKRLLKRNTRRYAKRQLTWFKKEKGIRWIEIGASDTPGALAEKILKELPDVGDGPR